MKAGASHHAHTSDANVCAADSASGSVFGGVSANASANVSGKAANSPSVLELQEVGKRYGLAQIIRSVSLAVRPQERLAIIGPNGAGKSTLFNLISGAAPLTQGSVLLHGQRIDGLPAHAIQRKGLARSFQVSSIFTRMSTQENLRCALLWGLGYRYSLWRLLPRQRLLNQQVDEWLHRLGLASQRHVSAMHLSYAQQRALELGMTMASGAGVVLLDEPTAGMSRDETRRFVALIREVTQGKTLLMVEHDMDVVFDLADRIAVLAQGQLLALDTPEAIRRNPQVQTAYLGAAARGSLAQAQLPSQGQGRPC